MSQLKDYLLKECSCGSNGKYFYICTYINCSKRGLICPYCLFNHHCEHSSFCIPIDYLQIQNLNESYVKQITNYKNTLIDVKDQLNTLLEDEIYFLEELESLSTINNDIIVKYDLLPKLSEKPQVNKTYTFDEKHLFKDIKEIIQEHQKNLENDLWSCLDELDSNCLQTDAKIMKIASEIISPKFKIFGIPSKEHVLTLSFTVRNENCFLEGIGYISQVFLEIPNSVFLFEITETLPKNRSEFTKTTKLISCDPLSSMKSLPEYPDVRFVTFNKIELVAKKSYKIVISRTDKNTSSTITPKPLFCTSFGSNENDYENNNYKKQKLNICPKSLTSIMFSFTNSDENPLYNATCYDFVQYFMYRK